MIWYNLRMSNFLSLFTALLALCIAVLALHRNAVLANKVGMCVMVDISLQHRLNKLENKE